MPMSALGSDGCKSPRGCGQARRPAGALGRHCSGRRRLNGRAGRRGFTLIELLVVLVLVAIGASIVSLAVRDGAATKLEEEGARLAALLEGARAESRAAGVQVLWVPGRDEPGSTTAGRDESEGDAFRWVGLPASLSLPRHWLEPRVSAQIVGGKVLVLGPDAIVAPQRVVLSLDDRRIEIATDGLAPFAVAAEPAAEAPR
jgi:general secretion pathway protein H